jgi:hypothetical protein
LLSGNREKPRESIPGCFFIKEQKTVDTTLQSRGKLRDVEMGKK